MHIPLTQPAHVSILAGVLFRVTPQGVFGFERLGAQLAAMRFQLALDRVDLANVSVQHGEFDEATAAFVARERSFIGVCPTEVDFEGERTWVGGIAFLEGYR